MDTLDNLLLIVLCVNGMLMLGQLAIYNIDPSASQFYNCQGSLLGSVEAGQCRGTTYALNDTDPASMLPSASTSVSPETGNIFTDAFTGLKNWLISTAVSIVPGLGLVIGIVSAPYNFLKAILPGPTYAGFVFVVGGIWYLFSLVVVVAWLFGRGN